MCFRSNKKAIALIPKFWYYVFRKYYIRTAVMQKKISNFVSLAAIVTILLIPIVLFFFIFIFDGFFMKLPSFIKTAYSIICIFILAPINFVLVFKSNHFKKLLERTSISYTRNGNFNEEYYSIDKKEYFGVTKKYGKLRIYKGAILLFIILVIIVGNITIEEYDMVSFIIIMLVPVSLIIYSYFLRIIIISPQGIKSLNMFKKDFMPWKKIKQIGICSPTGKNNSASYTYIYISDRVISNEYYDIKDKEGIITIQYRNSIIHHILCNWDQEIVNLVNTKRWHKYLEKHKESLSI